MQGTLTADASGTSSANGVLGTGATQGKVTDTGNMTSHADKLIYLAADGDYRIIDTVTANDALICGVFTSQPLSAEAYVIYSWGTSINKLIVQFGQKGVYFYDIEFDTNRSVVVQWNSSVYFYRCKISEQADVFQSYARFESCYLTKSGIWGHGVYADYLTFIYMIMSKCYCQGNSGTGMRVVGNSTGVCGTGTVLDSASTTGTHGLRMESGAQMTNYSTAANGYVVIRNFAVGINAVVGGMVKDTANNVYSGNTADETAVAIGYGYID